MTDGKKENIERCKSIADELELYISGQAIKCPNCGNVLELFDDYEINEDDQAERICPICEKPFVENDCEILSIYDYLTEVYDVEYRINSDYSYKSVQIMVAGGGPNIYVDTSSGSVELYWWSDRASYGISREVRDEIDSCFEELYEAR